MGMLSLSQGEDMALLKASVEANVPIQCADKVWSEFIRRSMYGSYARGFEDGPRRFPRSTPMMGR